MAQKCHTLTQLELIFIKLKVLKNTITPSITSQILLSMLYNTLTTMKVSRLAITLITIQTLMRVATIQLKIHTTIRSVTMMKLWMDPFLPILMAKVSGGWHTNNSTLLTTTQKTLSKQFTQKKFRPKFTQLTNQLSHSQLLQVASINWPEKRRWKFSTITPYWNFHQTSKKSSQRELPTRSSLRELTMTTQLPQPQCTSLN